MTEQDTLNYRRIAEAIDYIRLNFKRQPGLDEVAEKVHLSPFHFQRLFTEWAGVSPKKFLQYISVEHAKSLLKDKVATLFDAAAQTGLSGTGRLHDLFITIEGMTPGEYKNGGGNLSINYSYALCPFGNMIVASTNRGICYMAFADNEEQAFTELQNHFPNAVLRPAKDEMQLNAMQIFSQDWKEIREVRLHLKGTDFQLKVWQALLQIPLGQLRAYGSIAAGIGNPGASRAVGSAIGDNPVAFLIPCHRVIQSSGVSGNYHWGSTRKSAMIGWEAARAAVQPENNITAIK
jgi:AraC family transcriptional regulator of adaptative response/methylated-DNA-[protein]-cysteine methyltransferase